MCWGYQIYTTIHKIIKLGNIWWILVRYENKYLYALKTFDFVFN